MKRPLLLALALCATACPKKTPLPPEKTLDEVVQQYKAKVEPKLAAVEAIVAVKTPPVTKAELAGGSLEGRISATGVTPNLTIAYAEDLVDLTKPGDVKYPMELATRWVNQCAAALRKRQNAKSGEPTTARDAEAYLMRCEKLQYLAVIRTTRIVEPKVDAEKKEFETGVMEGDVVVFDLGAKTSIGGFPFKVENGETVSKWQQGGGLDIAKDLRMQLEKNIIEQFETNGAKVKSPG